MAELQCEFCKLKFKTESGYKKHACIQVRRYKPRVKHKDLPEVHDAYGLWLYFMTYHEIVPKRDDLKKMFMASADYNRFMKFQKYVCQENQCPNPTTYLWYLMINKVPYKNWLVEKIYEAWLFEFIMTEEYAPAIERSKTNVSIWEAKTNKTMSEMSAGHLSLMVGMGKISPWYVYSSDLKNIIQTNSVVDIVVDVSKILNKPYWTLKLSRLK